MDALGGDSLGGRGLDSHALGGGPGAWSSCVGVA